MEMPGWRWMLLVLLRQLSKTVPTHGVTVQWLGKLCAPHTGHSRLFAPVFQSNRRSFPFPAR
jgi:hypothetical protein